MPKIATKEIRDVGDGIITLLDEKRAATTNSVRFSQNLLYHKTRGRAVLRQGTALIGAQIANGQAILGLHQFILSSGTKHLLAVVNGASNSGLYRLASGAWGSESVSGVKDVKHRFLTFLDTVMVLDGTNATSSDDGDAWVTTGGNLDIGNCPKGDFCIEWRDKIYVAGKSGSEDVVYYSAPPATPTTTTISWTVNNGSFRVEPFEGHGKITGLGKVPGYLLIFKERALKRWNGASLFPDYLSPL